jgi:hypothetical protein
MTERAGPRSVRCPACGGPSEYSPANLWRPFCCERCKNHDFGAWASESYRVPDATGGSTDDPRDEREPRH